MATFIMFGKYASESIKGISAQRTEKAGKIIEKHGGMLKEAFALLGETDLILIVDFPDIQAAMKASLALNKLTGISFSTLPAVSVDEFDNLVKEV